MKNKTTFKMLMKLTQNFAKVRSLSYTETRQKQRSALTNDITYLKSEASNSKLYTDCFERENVSAGRRLK
jgi:hypothetical protein